MSQISKATQEQTYDWLDFVIDIFSLHSEPPKNGSLLLMREDCSTLFGKSSAGAHHSNIGTVTLHPEERGERGENGFQLSDKGVSVI